MNTDLLIALTHAILAQQRPGQPETLYVALEAITGRLIGHRLFTLLVTRERGRLVRRVHTSDAQAYPLGGEKEMGPTPWGELVLRRAQPWLGRSAEDIRWAFPDHALIASLGLGAAINIPVVYDDEVIGTMNLLHEAHWYRPEHVDLLLAFGALLVPAYLAARRGVAGA